MTVINESGLYAAILGSKVEGARRVAYLATAVIQGLLRERDGGGFEDGAPAGASTRLNSG